MQTKNRSKTLAAGMAIFSMFFGSGNLIFPLIIGQTSEGNAPAAIIGLPLTAILVPFLGLLAMVIYRGDNEVFFGALGKAPYLFVCTTIIALIGPFGVLPRCLTIAHAGVQTYFPQLPLLPFSIAASLFIFFAFHKKDRLVNILGYVLTPLLLLSLAIIIVKGLWTIDSIGPYVMSNRAAFSMGISKGYYTMDLLAAFFFCKTILNYFENDEGIDLGRTLKAGTIGLGLLALVYFSFAFLGASFSQELRTIPPEQFLMVIASHVLGSFGGFFASVAIVLACITTAMALAEVSTQFLVKDLFAHKISESKAIAAILIISIFVTTFEFSGIARFLGPILDVCYPFLIVLTLFNLGKKLLTPKSKKLESFSSSEEKSA